MIFGKPRSLTNPEDVLSQHEHLSMAITEFKSVAPNQGALPPRGKLALSGDTVVSLRGQG